MDEDMVSVGLGGLDHLIDGLNPLPDRLGVLIEELPRYELLWVHLHAIEVELLVI